jgi:hypothetical protein
MLKRNNLLQTAWAVVEEASRTLSSNKMKMGDNEAARKVKYELIELQSQLEDGRILLEKLGGSVRSTRQQSPKKISSPKSQRSPKAHRGSPKAGRGDLINRPYPSSDFAGASPAANNWNNAYSDYWSSAWANSAYIVDANTCEAEVVWCSPVASTAYESEVASTATDSPFAVDSVPDSSSSPSPSRSELVSSRPAFATEMPSE